MDIKKMLESEAEIREQLPKKIKVDNSTYTVRRVGNKVRTKISDLAIRIENANNQTAEHKTDAKARRLNRWLRRSHAKIAAYYILGNWALCVPFLHRIVSWYLDWKPSEHTFMISSAGGNNPDDGFFSLNWLLINNLLKQSTQNISSEIEKYLQRKENAEEMSKTDLQTSQDSK
jgi:hypothetical protein